MNHDIPAYGLWTLVVLNSAVFLIFAFSFSKPQTARDWRSFGAFAAFVVALFAEMYGFPLTIYLMSGWLQTRYPGLDILSHDSGHLWSTLMGETGAPHFGVPHIASYVFLGGGFWLLSSAWNVLYHAQRRQSVRGLRDDPARLPAAVADVADAGDVSDPAADVRAPVDHRGARGGPCLRRRVGSLCEPDAALLPNAAPRRSPACLTITVS